MDFKLPELGEGVQEGELVSWLVKEGDTVNVDQPLLEVMTDKATVEVPSTHAGKITSLSAAEGDMLEIGQVILKMEAGSSNEKSEDQNKEDSKEAPKTEEKKEASSKDESKSQPSQSKEPPQQNTSNAAQYQNAQQNHNASNVSAAPIVRVMAQREGVDLSQVTPSGPNNRVLEKDLLNFLNSNSAPSNAATGSARMSAPAASTQATSAAKATKTWTPQMSDSNWDENIEVQPLRGLRRVISKAMTKSKFTAPHYAYVDEFECTELIALRKQAKAFAAEYGISFSYLPFIVKATVAALKEYPVVNSSLVDSEKGQDLQLKKFYHIGIAVNTDQGLIVPVIKHADKKSLLDIAKEIGELSEKARTGKAKPEELKGSTFTITSMGNVGGLFATPIINHPEAGIMGVYKIQKRPVVKNDQIVVGNVMTLSLSLDHRIVDGVVGAEFCNAVIDRLTNPAKLMLGMI